jgi:hypothetical protein
VLALIAFCVNCRTFIENINSFCHFETSAGIIVSFFRSQCCSYESAIHLPTRHLSPFCPLDYQSNTLLGSCFSLLCRASAVSPHLPAASSARLKSASSELFWHLVFSSSLFLYCDLFLPVLA